MEKHNKILNDSGHSPDALFAQAVALHQSGNMDAAETIYKQLLTAHPGNQDMLAMQGIMHAQRNQFEEAVSFFNKAIAANPENAAVHYNLGNVLSRLGKYSEALESFNKTIALNPQNADAYYNCGVILLNLLHYDRAEENFRKAIAINPGSAVIHLHRIVALFNLKRYDEALTSCDTAIAINPNEASAHNSRGIILDKLKRYDEALASCDKAIVLKPDFAEAYNNRGSIVFFSFKRESDALKDFDKAIALNPGYAEAYNNRGRVLCDLGQYDDALANFDKAIAIVPNYADSHWNKGCVKLLRGEFEEGWLLYEWRWKKSGKNNDITKIFHQPLWLGKEDLTGKTIFIHAEQGFGDTIQFCRYIPMVQALGAKVLLSVQPPLTGLIASLKGSYRLLKQGDSISEFDFYCPLPSLPLAFKTILSSIPTQAPYLFADAKKQQYWQEVLGKKQKPRIGLVWAGAAHHANDYNRSMALQFLTPLLNHDFEFLSLQKDLQPDDQAFLANSKIQSFAEEMRDFTDTAALISEMDIIITVDTSVAHLAGALGKPVWVLLPYNPDFRWLLNREDSPWHPTAKLFRQEKAGDWEGVIKKVKQELASFGKL